MPRPLRIQFPGAWYHVMNRGAGHRSIFRTAQHRRVFLSLPVEIADTFAIEIHTYGRMTSHYHLLVSTPSGQSSSCHAPLERRLYGTIQSVGAYGRAAVSGPVQGDLGGCGVLFNPSEPVQSCKSCGSGSHKTTHNVSMAQLSSLCGREWKRRNG